MRILCLLILITCHIGTVRPDYDCMCCYSVEQKVFGEARSDGKPIGYMYEFDCKNIITYNSSQQLVPVEFEHQLGYVEQGSDMQKEICPGDPSDTDTITTSTTISTMPTKPSTTLTNIVTSSTTTSSKPTTNIVTSPTTTTSKPTTITTRMPTTTHTPTTPSSSTTTTMRTTTSTIKPSSFTAKPIVSSKFTTKLPTTSTIRTSTTAVTPMTTGPTVSKYHNVNTTNNPLHYIGVGYDIFHGNPGGIGRSQDGDDPGLLLSKRIFQLTEDIISTDSTAREVEIMMTPNCTNKKTTVVVNDGKSYQSEILQHITFPDTYKMEQMVGAFAYNKEFMQVRQETEGSSSTVYTDKLTSCYLGYLRYKEENANKSGFSVSRDFAHDVCNLDDQFNVTQYLDFVDSWGTNVVMETKMGTLKVDRFKTNARTLIERLQQLKQSGSILYPSGQFKGYDSSITVNSSSLATLNVPGIFGTLIKTATVGAQSTPAPIGLTLYPITEALDLKYWTSFLIHTINSDVCGSMNMSRLASIKTNLELALAQYSGYLRTKENIQGFQPLKEHAIQMPLTWPRGTYGLMKSTPGCPSGKVSWQEGFRKYDTEDRHAHNFFSDQVQNFMAGSYAADNIVTLFCMKTKAVTDVVYEREWPRGTYCILKYGTCPANFVEGFILWDDDDGIPPFEGNHNDEGGVLPFGAYGDNTEIHYCCRNDAPQTTPMYMPREKPFILMMFGSTCQHVHGMAVRELFVRWDDEDTRNKDSSGGAHPTDSGGAHDHLLHFCYYVYDAKHFPVNNVIVG